MSFEPSSAVRSEAAGTSPEQRFLSYAQSGDKAILQGLIEEYADHSYNQARRIVGPQGAEDVVQEAYLLLVRTAKRYDGSIRFAAWLGRLMVSTALNHRKHRQCYKKLSDTSEQGMMAMKNYAVPADTADKPELEVLRAALDELPDRFKAPLTLHYLGGLNQNETAQALGVPVGTIGVYLARGIERLRGKMSRAGYAITSAGILSIIANIPTYAAPPTLKAGLMSAASERLASAARHVTHRMLEAKGVFSAKAMGLLGTALLAPIAVTAGIFFARSPSEMPVSGQAAPAAVQISALPSDQGLIAHWTFDEDALASAIDGSGNGNNGVLVNGPVQVPGKIGKALRFDGVDDYVTVPSSASLNSIKGELTISAWLHKTSNRPGWGGIVTRRTGPETGDLWSLCYCDGEQGRYIFIVTPNETGERDLLGTNSASDLKSWTHLANVYDGAFMRFYHNGQMVDEEPCAGQFPNEITPVLIGASERGESKLENWVSADIDDVRIYNRALSNAEIATLAKGSDEQP